MSAVEELPRGAGTLRRALLLELAEFDPWTADADGLERASRVLGEVNRRLAQAIRERANELSPLMEAEEAARILWPEHLPRLDGALLGEVRRGKRPGPDPSCLSDRQVEVLSAFAAGERLGETAQRLGVSKERVYKIRDQVRHKLLGTQEGTTFVQAVEEAVRLGLITWSGAVADDATDRVIGRH